MKSDTKVQVSASPKSNVDTPSPDIQVSGSAGDVSGGKKETHYALTNRLKTVLQANLQKALNGQLHKPYVLLDHPDHSNVGDSAIYLGELAVLTTLFGFSPLYTCRYDTKMPDIEASIPDDAVIFLHGGGNFGDIWPHHQDFREEIVRRFSNHKIIQLPQSIHYDDPGRISQTAEAIALASDLTLLLRDTESLSLAKKHFDCDVTLCPDAALAIGLVERPISACVDLLLMLRKDKESVGLDTDLSHLPISYEIDDWGHDEANIYKTATWSARTQFFRTGQLKDLSRSRRIMNFYETLAQMRFDRGVAKLARGRFIITDRLHVHIISSLMGIPHAFLDNKYGKISRMSAAFSTRWAHAYRVQNMKEALEIAESELAEMTR